MRASRIDVLSFVGISHKPLTFLTSKTLKTNYKNKRKAPKIKKTFGAWNQGASTYQDAVFFERILSLTATFIYSSNKG